MGMKKSQQIFDEQVFATPCRDKGRREDSGLHALLSSPHHTWSIAFVVTCGDSVHLDRALHLNYFSS